MLTLLATLATSAAVAVSGTIGFVGLVVPHLLRLLMGPIIASCCRRRCWQAPGCWCSPIWVRGWCRVAASRWVW